MPPEDGDDGEVTAGETGGCSTGGASGSAGILLVLGFVLARRRR